ncbi:MAG TPA: hypothetical protein DCF68_03500 [Cyanothece sp. UBA12306]|nr:hypothetical protein [Cyanothece sp. UBA12306]
MLRISFFSIFLMAMKNPVIANREFPQNHSIQLIASSEESQMEEKSRLNHSLKIIDQMEESQLKVILLNDLALNYAQLGYQEKAKAILAQSSSIAKKFEDMTLKITTLTQIAKSYHQIGQQTQALEILDQTVNLVNNITESSLQGQLLLDISLKYGEMGQKTSAQTLFVQSQTIITKASQPNLKFPFQATSPTLKLGFSGNINSFRDTTALVGINVNFAQQWSYDDLFVDGNINIDYDSSRVINNYRPESLIHSVYRNHFNEQWNWFTHFFNTTNQDLFASKNDDEDLVIISELIIGAGLNLWRGDSPSNFLDFQLGIGPRYEYDYIDFEQRSNQTDPTLGIILLGRSVPLGEAILNQIFALTPALNNLDNYYLTSNTRLSIPLTKRWSFNNRLFVRYRNELVFESNPKWHFLFTTGLDYEF